MKNNKILKKIIRHCNLSLLLITIMFVFFGIEQTKAQQCIDGI